MALTGVVLSTALKSAGGFIFTQWKWIVMSIVLLVILFLSFKVYGAFKDRNSLLEERKGTITQLVKDNTELEIANQTNEQVIAHILADRVRMQKLYDKTVTMQEEIHAEITAQKQIFLDHDFTKLSNAKPGLIIKPMNKATAERFDEISNTFNN